MHAAIQKFLDIVDTQASSPLVGFYLVGSAALGDFGPQSDIDFIAVTKRPLSDADIANLRKVNLQRHRPWTTPQLDGIYVAESDLARDPRTLQPGLWTRGRRSGISLRTPIAWATLARCGVALRGPAPATLDIWDNQDAVAQWCKANLQTYWRGWLRQSARAWTLRGAASFTARGAAWGVLGVSRIHCTIMRGEIISKTAAADYAATALPKRWGRIIEEAKRIRSTPRLRPLYNNPASRRRDALGLVRHVIDQFDA